MFDSKDLLDQLIKVGSNMINTPKNEIANSGSSEAGAGALDPILKGLLTGVGGGMLGSMLASKGGTNTLGKVGGGAALATLAYRAYQNYMGSQGKSGNLMESVKGMIGGFTKPENFDTDETSGVRSKAMLLAIINTAKADGVFDESEREAITQEISKFSEDPKLIAWVKEELGKPIDIEGLAALATNPQIATEIYVASLAACRDPNSQEQGYLRSLREALGIDGDLKKSIEQELFS